MEHEQKGGIEAAKATSHHHANGVMASKGIEILDDIGIYNGKFSLSGIDRTGVNKE